LKVSQSKKSINARLDWRIAAGLGKFRRDHRPAAADKSTGLTSTYIQIAEAKAMQTGQVTVDTSALKAGLDADGKIALYGIYFDTGKAALKPESKAQLDEMNKLLQAQANLKVIIVGHSVKDIVEKITLFNV
jgi:outer membrane protein OmpA-like peptidoglycan-associated protein